MRRWFKEAVQAEYYIKIGLVVLGASVLFSELIEAGFLGIMQALIVVLSVWGFSFWLARRLKVDEELGVIRVARVVNAVAAGRILNLKTARSQIMGGVVWGIGMALHEETVMDHRFGRIMNANIAEYHIPVNADVHDIDVIFVDEPDDRINRLGVKGLGEIGIVGVAAAIANAVYHATGKRIRRFPITLDKLLD